LLTCQKTFLKYLSHQIISERPAVQPIFNKSI
jgi:hypothetical protein